VLQKIANKVTELGRIQSRKAVEEMSKVKSFTEFWEKYMLLLFSPDGVF
jgi:hypothetical protein